MTIILSDRQKRLLEAIIQEFTDTAEAVGSIHLPEKYELGVSPATVRNEMASLAKLGFIKKAHASSGRIPTSMAFKFFINEILDELEQISMHEETQVRESLFQNRFDVDRLLYESVKRSFEISQTTSFALFNSRVYLSGLEAIVDLPEYNEPDKLKAVMRAIENYDTMFELLHSVESDDEVKVMIGSQDAGNVAFKNSAVVFSEIVLHRGQKGYVGMIGPNRMDYSRNIPTIKLLSDLINQSLAGWN